MAAQLNLRRMIPWLLAFIVLGGVGWITAQFATDYVFDQTAQRGRTTLRLTVAGLKGALGQYRSLPQLISDKKNIQELLTSPTGITIASQVNRELSHINNVVGASDTYVLNNQGLTVAASNFASATSFVGQNFSYRPYFQDAVAGRQGRFFALGTTSQKRGYYFSSAVRESGSIVGVVVVKVNIDELESAWRSRDHEIIVTDENGVIFMSSRADWRYKSISPLSEMTLTTLKATRKYDQSSLSELSMVVRQPDGENYKIVAVENGSQSNEYLVQTEDMEAQDWSVHIYAATGPARTQAYTITATVALVLLSLMLGGAFLIQRRQRLQDRMDAQHEARLELENQVSLRTFDLNQANLRLVDEVNERKAAEGELRKTQADLVQAGKLAALGQISAALSHELNQPLAAVKSYADNAVAYLDRDNGDQARDNITRISALTDRMASISKHLRNFARKPNEQLSAVSVVTVINDALELIDRRIKNTGAQVCVNIGDEDLRVTGGQVRLQQVLVNLIGNGLDAMDEMDRAKVEIAAWREAGKVIISVRDFGPGIDRDVADQIFDPFFTTKSVGHGLGLGLSISYNIVKDFGGKMRAENHPEKGAVFFVELVEADVNIQEIAL